MPRLLEVLRAAVAVGPVRRAAAPADDTQRERSGPGFVMRLIDSRALPRQVFPVLELDADWQGPPPRSLTLSRPTPDGESDPAPERVALPRTGRHPAAEETEIYPPAQQSQEGALN